MILIALTLFILPIVSSIFWILVFLPIITKVNTCSHPKVNGIRSFATLCFD
jgi:uncharacterized membrane protein